MKKYLVLVLGMFLIFGLTSLSTAGYELKINDSTKATFGFKTQIWAQIAEDGSMNAEENSLDFAIRTMRLYGNGQIVPLVQFSFNVDWTKGIYDRKIYENGLATNYAVSSLFGTNIANTEATVRDATMTLNFMPELRVMAGLFRTPFSRTATTDSFGYVFPHAPSIAGGGYLGLLGDYRNAGLIAWGEPANGMVKYAVGIFDGELVPGAAGSLLNLKDSPMYAARIAISPLEPEKGYVTPATYFGKKKTVLTVGGGYLTAKYNQMAVVTVPTTVDLTTGAVTGGSALVVSTDEKTYKAWTADVFAEIPLGGGALTVEGAYLNYDRGVTNGKTNGYYASAAYLISSVNLQPGIRYEVSDRDGTVTGGEDNKIWTLGIGWVPGGHAAKINLEGRKVDYENEGTTPRKNKDYTDITLALQYQF